MTLARRGRAALVAALLLALALVAACGSSGGPGTGGAERSAALPDLTLAGFDGGKDLDLAELRGPAVINLWASWCGPCREEMPVLQQFHESYGDRVRMLGIDFQDTQTGKARALVEETGVTYDLVSDPEGRVNGNGAFPVMRGLPFMAFVDGEGRVTHVEAVVVDSEDELVGMVEEHLGVAL